MIRIELYIRGWLMDSIEIPNIWIKGDWSFQRRYEYRREYIDAAVGWLRLKHQRKLQTGGYPWQISVQIRSKIK